MREQTPALGVVNCDGDAVAARAFVSDRRNTVMRRVDDRTLRNTEVDAVMALVAEGSIDGRILAETLRDEGGAGKRRKNHERVAGSG